MMAFCLLIQSFFSLGINRKYDGASYTLHKGAQLRGKWGAEGHPLPCSTKLPVPVQGRGCVSLKEARPFPNSSTQGG